MGEQFTVYFSDLNLQAELPPDSVYPMGKIKSHFLAVSFITWFMMIRIIR